MRFSIVIPSFNQGRFLARALESIIRQRHNDTEIIVIDGGSSDETISVIHRYESHISYWVSEPDQGQSDALNKGFAHAHGDVYGWLNSDDIYCDNAFDTVVTAFREQPDKMVVYGNWYEIDEQDRIMEKVFAAPRPRIPHFSYEGFDANLQALFWKKEVQHTFGEFDVALHQVMDSDFLFTVILKYGTDVFYKVDAFLGAFRRHSAQKTERTKIDERAVNEQKMLDKKYSFPPTASVSGLYFRGRYVIAKIGWTVSQGGIRYAWKKIKRALIKRWGTY